MLLPVLIVGGTLGGVFTATEAGGIAVVYAVLVSSFVFRTVTVVDLWDAVKTSARNTASIYLLIAAATVVSYILIIGGVTAWVSEFAGRFNESRMIFLMVVAALLLVIGTFLEPGAAIVLLVPILAPEAAKIGIDPMQMAMVVILTLTVGLITPPVGVCLFAACRIADSAVYPVFKAVLPFFLAELGVVILLVVVPQLSSFLPGLFR